MSYYMHQSPEFIHKFETASNHFIELVAPFLLLLPRPRVLMMVGGSIQIFFQVREMERVWLQMSYDLVAKF